MEVEHLTAVLEASGVSSFMANMAAADRATQGPKDQLRALAEVSKIATEALRNVKMTAAQAVESRGVAEEIIRGVKGISDASRDAARELDRVHLDQTQALQTKAAAEEQVRSLKEVERQAIATRVATGGGGPGLAGVGRGVLLPAAIGAGALVAPAMGPAVLGLGAIATGFAATGVGALGTLMLAFQGVGAAINGDLKAFKDLGAEQQAFVQSIRSLDGWFDKLKETAAEKLFPALNQALHEALSPGTVAAITKAVSEFAGALGKAGEQFGRYFGSSQFQQIFGPLMQSGARNLAVMSDAVLHLFDALGQLGRAAIPLTNWFTTVIDKGAKFVDVWVQAKTASGGMASAMDEAKTSLELVGRLLGSLLNAVGALGSALYPVSKIAVKDLTDGLNALAGLIDRNKAGIRDFVSGALAAVVSTVRTLTPLVIDLAKAIGTVVDHMGGWKTAFEIVIGGVLVSQMSSLVTRVAKVGLAAETSAAEVRGLRAALLTLGSPAMLGVLAAAALGVKALIDQYNATHNLGTSQGQGGQSGNVIEKDGKYYLVSAANAGRGGPGGMREISKAQADALLGTAPAATTVGPGGAHSGAGSLYGVSLAGENPMIPDALKALAQKGYNVDVTSGYRTYAEQAALYARYVKSGFNSKYIAAKPGQSNHETGNAVDIYVNGKPVDQVPGALAFLKRFGLVADVAGDHEHLDLTGYGGTTTSPFGTDPAFTKNLGPKPPKPPVIPAGATHQATIASNYANLAQQLNDTGAQAQKYLDDELAALVKEKQILADKLATASGKAKTELASAVQKVTNEIRDVQTKIKDAVIVSGDALINSGLKSKLANLSAQFKADSDMAVVLTGDAADKYRQVLKGDLTAQAGVLEQMAAQLKAKLAAASGKQKAATQQELDKIQGQLSQVQDQVLSILQQNVQALQSQVSTIFSSVQSEMDTALGNLYYQNGLKTPSEQLLASMQQQDQLQSLQDAIDQAQQQLQTDTAGALQKHVLDVATGRQWDVFNPAASAQITADQKALDAAKRQLDEYNLSIKAAQERSQADTAYAQQVQSLNAQLANLEQQALNGANVMDQLRQLAGRYGIQISDQTIPDFNNLSNAITGPNGLMQAFADLAAYIEKITGKTPAQVPGGNNTPAAGTGGSFTLSNGSKPYTQIPIPGHPVYMARGGVVKATPGGRVIVAGEAGQDEAIIPLDGRKVGGDGITVNLHVSALDPESVDWAPIAEKIRREMYRTKGRNGRTLNF